MRVDLRVLYAAIVMLLGILLPNLAYAVTGVAWPLSYEGKSTNRFIWDKRAISLIESRVPAALAREVVASLGGPPDPVIVKDGRHVSVSACRSHDCGDKAFFWIDTATGAGLGAHSGYRGFMIGSNAFAADGIPAPAMQALLDWIVYSGITPAAIAFIDRAGRATTLDPARFTPSPGFVPPPTGPSFDCATALDPVHEAICADPALAQSDVDMATFVVWLRHGHDTTGDQAELTQFQQNWERARDQSCAAAPDMRGCLAEAYRTQRDRLENWLPSRH